MFPLILLLVVSAVMVRCDSALEPFGSQPGFYSIYGLLDLHSDEHYIRVQDLNRPLLGDSTRKLNVTVRFENLDTGEEEIMADSLVPFEGVYTHNFAVTLDILPGNTYRVSAASPEGAESYAVATTPHIVDVDIPPPTVNCSTRVEISFDPVMPGEDLPVLVGFQYRNQIIWSEEIRTRQIGSVLSLNLRIQSLINFAAQNNNVSPTPECFELSDDRMFLKYTHYSAGFFDPIESDTTTIPGGTGQFGSLYRDSFSFPFDTVRICTSDLCFKPPDDYCVCGPLKAQ